MVFRFDQVVRTDRVAPSYKDLEHFSLPPFEKMALKTVQWNVNIFYYFDCCCCCCQWWYLLLGLLVLRPSISSLLQSATNCYYKVRQLILLQSVLVCYYKLRRLFLLQRATSVITKCDRRVYREKYRKISFFILVKMDWVVAVRFFYFGMPVRRLFEDNT